MSRATVGKWGDSLAIRVPADVARDAGLTDGEDVEIETQHGDLVIRRSTMQAESDKDALQAVDEMIAESQTYSIAGFTIRELLDDGRRV